MKKLIRYIMLLPLLLVAACSGFLDEYPATSLPEEDTYNSYADFKGHWMSVYTSLKNPDGFTEACRINGDLQCDLGAAVQGNTRMLDGLYSWTFNADDPDVTGIYFAMWKTIGRINNLFDHLPHFRNILSGKDSLNMEEMVGDLYFVRALCYSELVKYYCEAYDPATAHEQLGMPICTTANVKNPTRASLEATYQFMFDDLIQAEDRMTHLEQIKMQYGGNYFFTLECVQALRARIALYKGDYPLAAGSAKMALDYCLDLGMSLGVKSQNPSSDEMVVSMNLYASMFRESDYSIEVIHFLAMTANDVQGSVGQYFAMQPDLTVSQYHPEFVPSNYLLKSYSDTDIRASVIFERHKTDYPHGLTCDLLMKDSQNPDLDKSINSNYQTRPKMFRLSELYLIIAEANAMPGGVLADGLKALEKLRKARIVGYNQGQMTAEELLEEVKVERVRELCFEGFRLMDLKRWHQGFRRTVQPFTSGNQLNVSADDPRFTWPIPQHELKVNPNMKPNRSN